LNLVGNAVKFTRNGQISVEIERLGDRNLTEIRVRDTGIGIPQADQARIFDDFVTLDATYARRASGTGLGLGIVKRIVQQMGGTLEVESQENRGSTFRVLLPLVVLDEASAVPLLVLTEPRMVKRGPNRTVTLVVEDNEFNRVIVREMLAKEGHEVVEARDGIEGIALAAGRKFDLILMDISMPRVDGLQAARSILSGQGASRKTPIVAMTAHALAEETERFRAGGMVAVLVKPITREALKAVLQRGVVGQDPGGATRSAADLLDRNTLDALARDLGLAKSRDLLTAFRLEAETTVARVDNLADKSTFDQNVQRDLHRLMGSAGIFGASALQTLLSTVETALKTGAIEQARTILCGLRPTWQATEAALQELPAFAQPSSLR